MKKLTLFLVIGVVVCVLNPHRLDADQDGVFFDSSQLSHELDEIAKDRTKSVSRFELKTFQDEQLKTAVPPDSDIGVSVVPLVPAGRHKGADLEKINPAKVNDAKKGCTAEYDKTTGKVFVTLRRPYVFQDMRDATSSRTWAYRIDVKLTTVGRTTGVGGGVQGDSSRECVSFFGILSQKEGKTWKPRKNDHYKYEPELGPNDWQSLGKFNVDTIYSDEAKATFQWKPDTEGKSVSVRWHITGDDKETFEDVWTDWLTQSNPCASSPGSPTGGPPQETGLPAATPPSLEKAKPQSPVPRLGESHGLAPDTSTQTQLSSNKMPSHQPLPSMPRASYTSPPDGLTQTQALLDRAKRSNHAVTRVYYSLISRVPTARRGQLKQQQDEWLKMRSAEAGDEELLAEGSNSDPNVLRRFAEMNEARAMVLKATLRTE